MGRLLRFSPKVPRLLPVAAGKGPGQVILFTGVRYERGTVDTAPKPERKLKRTRKG